MKKRLNVGNYIVIVYLNGDFVGYVKEYRLHRNKKYRFDKTKNINKALKFVATNIAEKATDQLNNFRDDIYNNFYTFKHSEITNQELRRSKLSVLKIVKIREGIFKNKIV